MSLDLDKNKVIFYEDIIEELSEETGIPYEEYNEIMKLNLNYIKNIIEDKDTLSVLLPKVGTLFYSERISYMYNTFLGEIDEDWKDKKNEMYKHRLKIIEDNEEKYGVKSLHKRRPLLYKFKSIYKKVFRKKIKRGATKGRNNLWTEMAELQNKIQNGEK